jgi:agmatinase
MTPTLLGVPYDASSSYLRGAAEAPALIREVFRSPAGNVWSELGVDVSGVLDAGDLVFPNGADPRRIICGGVLSLLEGQGSPLVLGGDHSITYPVLRALRPHHPVLTILHIDAHGDLYDHFEGDRYSHACPFARIMEEGLADRLVQVGIRTETPHQREQIARFNVETIEMRAWADAARPSIVGPVYVSLDLDGIDPAYAPGVSHREPGGLSVRDVVSLIHSLEGPVIGADIVEFNPRQDLGGVTASVAAKFLKELAAQMLRSQT